MLTSERVVKINNAIAIAIAHCVTKKELDDMLLPYQVDDYCIGYIAARIDIIWAERVIWVNKQYVWKSDLSRVFIE